MTEILLIRHAHHAELGARLSGRSGGGGLTGAGRDAARRLAARLAYEPVSELRSSPVARARDTAQCLAATLHLPVSEDAAFDEVDFGDWTGQPYAVLAGDAAWQHWNASRAEARVPGGETMGEALDRAMESLGTIRRRMPGAIVAIVTHCDIIRGVLTELLGRSLDRIHDLDVPPASVSRIAMTASGCRVLSVGEDRA